MRNEYQDFYTTEEQELEKQENKKKKEVTKRITEIISKNDYKKHVGIVKEKISQINQNYKVIGEKLGKNKQQYEIFFSKNTDNTIYVGVSFGQDRWLLPQNQYEIKVECSANLADD